MEKVFDKVLKFLGRNKTVGSGVGDLNPVRYGLTPNGDRGRN